ncbi:MAG TPA: hypothetical protein VFZ58_02500 [Candidatus Saccharimonadales bacterium]
MRIIVIYKDNSEHARPVIDFLREFKARTGRELETLNPESREGASFCETYDIVEYPTLIALDDEGRMLNQWIGLPLPTINEISYYT